jgi:hypothetical protein
MLILDMSESPGVGLRRESTDPVQFARGVGANKYATMARLLWIWLAWWEDPW